MFIHVDIFYPRTDRHPHTLAYTECKLEMIRKVENSIYVEYITGILHTHTWARTQRIWKSLLQNFHTKPLLLSNAYPVNRRMMKRRGKIL